MDIYVYVGDNYRITGYGSTESPGTVLVSVPENHEVLIRPHAYVLEDGKLVKELSWVLTKIKQEKDAELNIACQDTILGGFDFKVNGKVYHFSYDNEAQINLQKAAVAFDKGFITEKDFTVKNAEGKYERIVVSKAVMKELEVAEFFHVDSNIKMYRDELLPRVMEAKTVDEVKKIVWK